GLLKTRMMPVGAQFETLCQCVRQAAAAQDAVATLRARGAEVVLERSQMEALSEVLGPLLKACVQHGLDSAGANGRADPGEGQIELEVAQPRFDVTVEISYRGRPLSTAVMSELAPALEALGAIAESTPGDGGLARVSVLIPGPPQPMDLLLVEVGRNRYALPLKHISGVAKTPAIADRNGGHRLIEVEGRPHRLTSLAQVLGLESAPANGGTMCVLIDGGGSPLACRVDSVIGRERMLVRSTGPLLAANPWVLGVVVDATAAPALVLDLETLGSGPTSGAG
ncbi:MAG: chemotaxis protein CheW, partial [Gammaproteobacteria bacterium]|nr:chemotaxis protein CheW [Gammaproteobacteria bacterium]